MKLRQDENEILIMYKYYKSAIKIANFFGCSEITIRRIIKSLTNKNLRQIKKEVDYA